nr:hypothetical protein [uncultured Marinifilum sp.]
MDFYDFIFEGFCRKTNSSDTTALRNYFISKALEFEHEIQRDNFFDDLDYAINDIIKRYESIIYRDLDKLESRLQRARSQECKDMYKHRIDTIKDVKRPVAHLGFQTKYNCLISIKDIELIRKAFNQTFYKREAKAIKNPRPDVFTDEGYRVFLKLDEKYPYEDDKPFTKYGLIGRYLSNEYLLAHRKKDYIEFIQGSFDEKFTRIESFPKKRIEKMTSIFNEVLGKK